MIKVTSNASQVAASLVGKIKAMEANVNDRLLRLIAQSTLTDMKKRIHEHGEKADGSQIGEYSNAYMKIREGNFKNSEKFKKGKKKGEIKNAGVFTKGENKGSKRINYNRGDSRKIIFSLSGNMENQFVVIPTQKGYGLGWLDDKNPKKAEGLQFGNSKLKDFGIVYQLTEKEKQSIQPIIKNFLKENLK